MGGKNYWQKRKSREVFFSLFILAMISLQFLNPIMQKYGRGFVTVVRGWLPYLWLLPSSIAGDAVARSVAASMGRGGLQARRARRVCCALTVLLWMRYAQLYSGERTERNRGARAQGEACGHLSVGRERSARFFCHRSSRGLSQGTSLSPQKYVLFFGLIFPPMLVLFFSVQFAGAHPTAFKKGVSPDLFFPGMMAYLVLILIAPAYNNFAYEGKGIQTYFTSPTGFREILVAKNLVTALLLLCEIAFCVVLVGWRAGLPSTPVLFATLAGMIFSIVGQLTIANWSSLNFPRRMEFGKMQGQRNSGMSVLIMFGVQILFGGVSACILFSGRWTGSPGFRPRFFLYWLLPALAGYFSSLDSFTDLAEKKERSTHRHSLPLKSNAFFSLPMAPFRVSRLSRTLRSIAPRYLRLEALVLTHYFCPAGFLRYCMHV